MPAQRNRPKRDNFNTTALLPFQLRLEDFEIAMQDVYDLFCDVNTGLLEKGLERLDDFLRPAIMSGLLSDLLTASLSKHSRALTQNNYFNGHPDLVVKGAYPNDSVKAGTEGVEIKTTRKSGGAVDTHGARDQWMAVFVYNTDNGTEPARERGPMAFTEIYLAQVSIADFRKNARGELGTRTATLHRLAKASSRVASESPIARYRNSVGLSRSRCSHSRVLPQPRAWNPRQQRYRAPCLRRAARPPGRSFG